MNIPPRTRERKPVGLWKRAVRVLLLLMISLTGLLVGCQGKLLYFPSRYRAAEMSAFLFKGGRALNFTTGQGKQTAWLIPPSGKQPVDRLWIVCGGNAATALGMAPFCETLHLSGDAFLLVDYPGYGVCEGSPHPSRIRESLRTVIPLAAKELGMPEADLPRRACVFGHSLGCAAALIAVEEFHIRSAVLCSPFTSTMDMTRVVLKLPLGPLVWHRFDNRAGLAALEKDGGHAWILHGTEDTIIPVEMSRELAREFPATVTLREVPGTGHNDILTNAAPGIATAMAEARRKE